MFGTIIGDAIRGYSTARKLGITADIVANVASSDRIVAAAKNSATEGFYVATSSRAIYRDTNPTPPQLDLIERFNKRYGQDPGGAIIYAHMQTKLLLKALEDAGRDLTVDSFIAAMENIKDFDDGIGTPLHSYSSTSHVGTEGVLLDVVNKPRETKFVGIHAKLKTCCRKLRSDCRNVIGTNYRSAIPFVGMVDGMELGITADISCHMSASSDRIVCRALKISATEGFYVATQSSHFGSFSRNTIQLSSQNHT